MDNYPISSKSLEKHYHINGDHFEQQYKNRLSDCHEWDQKEHPLLCMFFPDNLGPCLNLDETSLSNEELYTIETNKSAKGQKGALVAMVKGTKSESVIEILKKMDQAKFRLWYIGRGNWVIGKPGTSNL